MKKYVLYPGLVRSKTDGQNHYINAVELCRLYQVKWDECIVIDKRKTLCIRNFSKMIHLYPREDGNYSLPKEPKETYSDILERYGLIKEKKAFDKTQQKVLKLFRYLSLINSGKETKIWR